MDETDAFLAVIERVQAANGGESDRALSIRLTGSPDTIRKVRATRKLPGTNKLRQIADGLGLPMDQLAGRIAADAEPDSNLLTFPRVEAVPANIGDVRRAFRDMPDGLPVYGTALGHNIQFDDEGGADIEVTYYEPTNAILYVARPPALMNVREAYGFYVQGDSMAPAHKDGVLRFANPRAPVRVTDDVVIQLRAPIDDGQDGEEIVSILVKTLVKRTASFVTLEQLNPHARFNVPTERIAAIHRVMELDDLFRRG